MNENFYLSTGRVNQKIRTRQALLDIAADMIREGKSLTIGKVADRAGIGRTTAYRYFPTVELLTAHAALWKVAGTRQEEFEKSFKEIDDIDCRIRTTVEEFERSTNEHRNEFRAMLRVSLDPAAVNGERRSRVRYIVLEKALDDVRKALGRSRFERLVRALCLIIGIESQIVMEDICLASSEIAVETKLWAGRILLQASLDEAISASQTGNKIPVE